MTSCDNAPTNDNTAPSTSKHILLFYKYAPLSDDPSLMERFRSGMETLCTRLQLEGRILIGISSTSEGINGSLSGSYRNVLSFTHALLGEESAEEDHLLILEEFRECIRKFAAEADVPEFRMDAGDFKWSSAPNPVFPDLKVALVRELIGTGGKLSSIPVGDTGVGYLTPEEWHANMQNLGDAVLIDCRNHMEYQIGHFEGALDPNTKTFDQFPSWVQRHRPSVQNKTVFMYCTGGIRCEKASAYIRKHTEASEVYHLKGGIHRYIERYGDKGFFRGKNFVFHKGRCDDPKSMHRRWDDDATNDTMEPSIVGKCQYCQADWDQLNDVCTVCRAMTLVCPMCRERLRGEYHCSDHFYLRHCYFTDLSIFSKEELRDQLSRLERFLEEMAVGKRYRWRRKTLRKQHEKISLFLKDMEEYPDEGTKPLISRRCRGCGKNDCSGDCWELYGLGVKNDN